MGECGCKCKISEGECKYSVNKCGIFLGFGDFLVFAGFWEFLVFVGDFLGKCVDFSLRSK